MGKTDAVVIVATVGKPTLTRTIDSILAQLVVGGVYDLQSESSHLHRTRRGANMLPITDAL
jgi:hypothetical protein